MRRTEIDPCPVGFGKARRGAVGQGEQVPGFGKIVAVRRLARPGDIGTGLVEPCLPGRCSGAYRVVVTVVDDANGLPV
jgi:hypothetical protein